jgi:aminotransferase
MGVHKMDSKDTILSKRAESIGRTKIRAMYELQDQYKNVISFAVGEPDFATPSHIVDACIKAIKEGKTTYAPNSGILELRKAIADYTYKTHQVSYSWEDEILITAGGMNALRSAIDALINTEDEVIVPNPYWSNHANHPVMALGKSIKVPVYEEDNFMYNKDQLKKYVTDKTKVIILNSPSNPTGCVIDKKTLTELCDYCIEKDLIILSDEVYQRIIYDGRKFLSPVMIKGMKERTIICNSFSKSYSMTGWRLGYALGPKNIINAMLRINENTIACAPTFVQYAGVTALRGPQDCVDNMVEAFCKRRDIIYERINKMERLKCIKPQGAFYAFVNIKDTKLTSDEFSKRLLHEKQVTVIPGNGFGDAGSGYIRMSYALSEKELILGLNRIEEFVKSL